MIKKFNIIKFLKKNHYDEEIIKDSEGKEFCRNYQKEYEPDKWNAITIFAGNLMSAADGNRLLFEKRPIPNSRRDAINLLLIIEENEKSKQSTKENHEIDPGKDRNSGPEEEG